MIFECKITKKNGKSKTISKKKLIKRHWSPEIFSRVSYCKILGNETLADTKERQSKMKEWVK